MGWIEPPQKPRSFGCPWAHRGTTDNESQAQPTTGRVARPAPCCSGAETQWRPCSLLSPTLAPSRSSPVPAPPGPGSKQKIDRSAGQVSSLREYHYALDTACTDPEPDRSWVPPRRGRTGEHRIYRGGSIDEMPSPIVGGNLRHGPRHNPESPALFGRPWAHRGTTDNESQVLATTGHWLLGRRL